MCRRRATGKSSHTRYSWATNHGAAAPIGSHSDSERKSYSGLPACSPREDDRLVCPAWRVGSWVPQSPIARPSDPIHMSFETGLLLPFFAHSLAHGRCANYLINRDCSRDSGFDMDRAGDRFYTTAPNLFFQGSQLCSDRVNTC